MKNIKNRTRKAFTMIEALVVIAITVVLAAVLLPALVTPRTRAPSYYCINNLHQIILAWTSYSQDFQDKLVPIAAPGATNGGWVLGDMSIPAQATNSDLIKQGLLFPYCPNVKLWKCPQDRRTVDWPKSNGAPTVRSISMNGFLNPVGTGTGFLKHCSTGSNAPSLFRTYPQITNPASTWVTIEEHPNTINDGRFLCEWVGNTNNIVGGTSTWGDLPALWHNGACSVSFADGHSEIRKWKDPALLNLRPKADGGPGGYKFDTLKCSDPTSLAWLAARTAY